MCRRPENLPFAEVFGDENKYWGGASRNFQDIFNVMMRKSKTMEMRRSERAGSLDTCITARVREAELDARAIANRPDRDIRRDRQLMKIILGSSYAVQPGVIREDVFSAVERLFFSWEQNESFTHFVHRIRMELEDGSSTMRNLIVRRTKIEEEEKQLQQDLDEKDGAIQACRESLHKAQLDLRNFESQRKNLCIRVEALEKEVIKKKDQEMKLSEARECVEKMLKENGKAFEKKYAEEKNRQNEAERVAKETINEIKTRISNLETKMAEARSKESKCYADLRLLHKRASDANDVLEKQRGIKRRREENSSETDASEDRRLNRRMAVSSRHLLSSPPFSSPYGAIGRERSESRESSSSTSGNFFF